MLNSAASVSFSLDEQWPDRLLIWHVRPREAHQRLRLPLPRRDRARGRPRQAAHHQEPRPQGGRHRLRRPRAPGHLRGPLRRAGARPLPDRRRQPRRARLQAHRRAAPVRAAVGGDRLPRGRRGSPVRAQLRVPGRARRLRHRAAPDHGLGLGPGLRDVAVRLRHPRCGRLEPPPPLPRHGLARRGTPCRRAGRGDPVFPAHGQGPRRGGAVRAPARPLQRTLGGVLRHDLAVVHRRRREEPRQARLLEGPPPRPDADDRGRGDRCRGPAVCSEMWPGNTADVTVLVPVIDRLRARFAIGRVCVVADRGMISAATMAALEERGLEYLLGARERTDKVVRTVVLKDERPFTPLCIQRVGGEETQLFVKEVKAKRRRYIVCRNEAEAKKDAADRQAVVAALEEQLKRGYKALIGNAGYRRYLRRTGKSAFEIDIGKLAEEARYDGIFVLRTNTRIMPLQAVLRYCDLIRVEQLFRTAKSLMRTRPIYHSSDAAIRGHVFCSFLALVLRKELDERCRNAGWRPEWGDVLRGLDRLQEVAITKEGRQMTLRTPATGVIGPLFKAARIALPPNVRDASAA